jgi:hypothetical protein
MELVFAYIDPGSGSLIIQGLIAALVALPVLFRNQIRRFASTFRGAGSGDKAASDTPEGQSDA